MLGSATAYVKKKSCTESFVAPEGAAQSLMNVLKPYHLGQRLVGSEDSKFGNDKLNKKKYIYVES